MVALVPAPGALAAVRTHARRSPLLGKTLERSIPNAQALHRRGAHAVPTIGDGGHAMRTTEQRPWPVRLAFATFLRSFAAAPERREDHS